MKCISCNKNIANDTSSSKFNCPNCNNEKIVRCSNCRKRSVPYICKKCGYEGP